MNIHETLAAMVESDEVIIHAVLILDVLEPSGDRDLRARTYAVTSWEARGMLRDADSLLEVTDE